MKRSEPSRPDLHDGRKPMWGKMLAVAACVMSAAVLLAFARRPVISVDLGYHLAYGREFLDTGRIVSDDSFISPPADPSTAGQLPPGASFDAEGNYRFPNANWLTQVILAALWRAGGWGAMNAALLACVAAVAIGQAMILRRLGVPPAWLAGVWLAAGLVGYERFMVRPELPAFVCLVWQVWLLCGRITWPRVAAFVAVHLLAVNLHSYWLLGAGVAIAFAADAALRAAWNRWAGAGAPTDPAARKRLIRLAFCAAAMVPAAMVHPAGPANVAYPFRTLAFLSQHNITGRTRAEISQARREETLHPWQTIGEFQKPFTARSWASPATWALAALLAAAAGALAVLLASRRWALAAMVAAFSLTALSMRRNMAIPAFIVAPLIAAAAHTLVRKWRPPALLGAIAQAATLLGGAAVLYLVVTNTLYLRERRACFFGGGVSALMLPVDACQWLDEHLPSAQPAYTGQNISSSVVGFSEKITAAPTLTNTWAAPPSRISRVFEIGEGDLPLSTLDAWGFDTAVLQGWEINRGVIRSLLRSDDWALVHIDRWFLVFARRTDENAAMIADNELTSETFDAGAFIDRLGRIDPIPTLSLRAGASCLQVMGWHRPAADAWAAVTAEPAGEQLPEAWLNRGRCLKALHAGRRVAVGDPEVIADLAEARRCMQKAIDLRGDYNEAKKALLQVDAELRALRGRR